MIWNANDCLSVCFCALFKLRGVRDDGAGVENGRFTWLKAWMTAFAPEGCLPNMPRTKEEY